MKRETEKETNLPGNSSSLITSVFLSLEVVFFLSFSLNAFINSFYTQYYYIPNLSILDIKPLLTFPKRRSTGYLSANYAAIDNNIKRVILILMIGILLEEATSMEFPSTSSHKETFCFQ